MSNKVIVKDEYITLYDNGYCIVYDCSIKVMYSNEVKDKIIDVYIENGVNCISKQFFKNCKNMVSVNIPNSVTVIADGAFYGCSSLKRVYIPNSVIKIGTSVFAECTSLQNVLLSERLQTLNSECFKNCKNLTSVVIPDSVTSIYDRVFMGCNKLENVVISENATYIGESTFSGCKIHYLIIPKSVRMIGFNVFDKFSPTIVICKTEEIYRMLRSELYYTNNVYTTLIKDF